MTSYYLDTSVLVTALTHETESRRIQVWLEQTWGDLVVSEWVATEFASALSLKQRTRQIDAVLRADALAEFARLKAASFRLVAVEAKHFKQAEQLINRQGSALRAGDALHTAIAQIENLTLCTRDKTLVENCQMFSIDVLPL